MQYATGKRVHNPVGLPNKKTALLSHLEYERKVHRIEVKNTRRFIEKELSDYRREMVGILKHFHELLDQKFGFLCSVLESKNKYQISLR